MIDIFVANIFYIHFGVFKKNGRLCVIIVVKWD